MIYSLDDVCEFINGGAWSDKEYVNSGLPVLKVTNCKPKGFVLEDIDYLPKSSALKYAKHKLKNGDVVIATVGSHPNLVDSAAGRSCIINSLVEGFYLNQNAVCIRTKDSDVVDQWYLGYLTKYRLFQHYIQMRGKGAANQMRIAIGAIKSYVFDFPEIDIQRTISGILSAYDDLIENNQRQIRLLEEAAQRLYKEWFVDLRFPGYENTPIVDGVPEGWTVSNIGNLCSRINAGGTPSRSKKNYWNNPTIKWFKTGELQDCWLIDSDEMINQEGLDGSSAKIFPKNTILMAIYASPTLGRLGILSSNAACNQAALCLLADESKISWQWLYSKLYELRDDFNAVAKGAGQQNISADTVKKKEVIIPTKRLMDEFNSLVAPLYNKRLIMQKQIINLSQARDRLLPKLMSGEMEV